MSRARMLWLRGLTTTVLPHERAQWAAAGSLEDMCQLTTDWLIGRLESQPGYYGPVDIDQAPQLLQGLLAANAAGLCTRNSQRGFTGWGADGAIWSQHAAVTGYASTPTWIRLLEVLDGTRYRMLAHPVRRRWRRARPGVTVTYRAGVPHTTFGVQLGAGDVAYDLDGAGRAAIRQAVAALQVTIWDPTPGGNDLWAHLATIPPASAAPRALGGGLR